MTVARMLLALALGAALPAAGPARAAEFPVGLRAWAGVGLGSVRRSGASDGPVAGTAGADLVWRRAEGRALVLSGVLASASSLPSMYIPESPTFSGHHYSLMLGFERSSPPGAGIAVCRALGVGVGRIETRGHFPLWPHADVPSERWAGEKGTLGLALGATVCLRAVPRPGPMGFVVGANLNGVFASGTSGFGAVLFVGIAAHPRPTS